MVACFDVWLHQATSNSYNMVTRALADLSPEGDKSAKRPRGHVITITYNQYVMTLLVMARPIKI